MAVSQFKTYAAGEVLTASDLNSSLTQITSNGEDLGWPATKAKDLNGFELIFDADADTSITADTDDILHFRMQGQDLFILNGATSTAVNGLQMTASAAGGDVILITQGSDTNIDLDIQTKGSGSVLFNGAALFANLVEDTTPQFGGMLDVNGNAIGDGTRELLTFTEDGSAINHVNIENQAIGGGPIISAAGDDTNVPLLFLGKGSGQLTFGDAALLWPDSDGTAKQVLQTDGSAALTLGNVDPSVLPAATDSAIGALETATQAEQETATATDKIVTPGRQHFHPGSAKIWAAIDGEGTVGVDASYNGGGGLADNGTGDYTLTFDITLSSSNYAAVTSCDAAPGDDPLRAEIENNRTTTTVTMQVSDDNGIATDADPVMVVIYGDI